MEVDLTLAPFYIPHLLNLDITEHLHHLFPNAIEQTMKKGDVICERERRSEHVVFILDGIMADIMSNANGFERWYLYFKGAPFYLSAVLHQRPRFYHAHAFTDVSLLSIERETFLDRLQEDRALMNTVLMLQSLESRYANFLIAQGLSCDTLQKVAQVLYFYHALAPQYHPLASIRLTQKLLGNLAGVHRTSVNHAVQTLRQAGVLPESRRPLSPMELQYLKLWAFPENGL